jgi:hypothetical protein
MLLNVREHFPSRSPATHLLVSRYYHELYAKLPEALRQEHAQVLHRLNAEPPALRAASRSGTRSSRRQAGGAGKQDDDPPEPTEDQRPAKPTRDYCLLPGGRMVRWQGQVEVAPRLYRLLDVLLGVRSFPVQTWVVEDELWPGERERLTKTLRNFLYDLNHALVAVAFPLAWRVRVGFVYCDG